MSTPSAGAKGASTRIRGHVAGAVLLAVGHERDLSCSTSAPRRHACRPPPRRAARSRSRGPRVVGDARQDALRAALLRLGSVQRTGSAPEASVRSSRSWATFLPLALHLLPVEPLGAQARRGLPATAAPSRSVAITSSAMSSPFWTKAPLRCAGRRSAGAGWTRSGAVAVQAWRFTSITVASAVTSRGRGGSAARSRCAGGARRRRRCAPANVSLRSGPRPLGQRQPPRHEACRRRSRRGSAAGRRPAARRRRQLTSAPGSAPPA